MEKKDWTEKEVIALLEKYRDHPFFGAMTEEQMEENWNRISTAIGFDSQVEEAGYTWKDYAEYGVYLFRENVARPLAIGFAALAVLLGGWTGMVGASFDSVPGDVLYPVKIANEKAQLSLAFSDEQKVKLHVEFASRRLDEAVAISSSDHPEKDMQIKAAMDNFAREVTAVSQQIEAIKEENLESAAELVKIVDRKVDEYETVLEKTKDELGEEMVAVEEAVNSAGNQVVQVLVENQEANQEQASSIEDLEKRFQKDYTEINQRYNLSMGRIAGIEEILGDFYLEGESEYYLAIRTAEEILRGIKPSLHEAMNIMAAGGYRGAFETIREIYGQLIQVESELARVEIEITLKVSVLLSVDQAGIDDDKNLEAAVELELELTTEGEAVKASESESSQSAAGLETPESVAVSGG